jgi:hypothetical protein
MNPTQNFEFARNWIYSKNIKFNRVPLGRNRTRPSRTARARPASTRAHDPWPHRARPVLVVLARPTCAAHGHWGTVLVGLVQRSTCGPAWPTHTMHGARREHARATHTSAALHGGSATRRANGGTAPARGRRRSGWRGFGPRRSGHALLGRRREGRDGRRVLRGGRAAGARGETALSGRRRAVLTALLTHGSCAAHGSHVATARCRAGPARRVASDRWGPLVSVFRIKNHPGRK